MNTINIEKKLIEQMNKKYEGKEETKRGDFASLSVIRDEVD